MRRQCSSITRSNCNGDSICRFPTPCLQRLRACCQWQTPRGKPLCKASSTPTQLETAPSQRLTPCSRYAALYETFPSHDSTGQFFLDSALPCAAVRGDACPSSSVLDEADSSHLELVRELVKAAAASLNATSDSAAMCGSARVLYCTADVRQPARMNPSHMDTVLIPALSSLLRLPALSFVDLCRHGCGAARSLAERMAAADSSVSLVVVDVNVALGDGAAPSDSSAEDSGVFGDLDALVGSCCSAIARGCKLRIVLLLPKAASSALFLEKLPSVSRAAAGHVTTCQLQTDLVLSWDELDDCVVSASLPLLFSMMCILRSIHYNPDDQQSPHTSWWQQWDAEEAILKAISPSLLTATSMLKSRPCNSSTRPVSRVATASSRISSRSSLLSRGSTSSIVAKSGATLGEPPALACTFPAIICTFADEANAEEVLQWFTSGASRLLAEQDSQSAVDSNPNQSTNAGAFSPIFATAARFGTARTTMVAENVCEELISSLARQLHGQRAHEVASEVGSSGCRDLAELQLKLAALILCDESEQRGVILLLPCSSPAILDCFHASLNAVPSHVVIMLLTPVHTAHYVQSWLHPTIQTRIDDVGAAPVHISVATAAGSRMPACINGGECSAAAAADAESAAADQPSVSVSWNQIYDTRCAMMMHRDFAKHALTKSNSSAKLPQLQHRVSSPYSPSGSPRPRVSSPYSATGSPRLSSPSHEIDGDSGGRRSPLSSSLMRRSPAAALGRQPMCCQALSVACQVFSSQAVGAVIGAVLACPGLPLHLISAAASAVARLMARDAATMSPNALPSHRELRTAAVCLAPFFFDTRVAKTELSFSVKFPNLLHNFEAQFGVSPAKWEELQQAACSSLLLVADPAADGTFVGLAAAGTWLCENLLLMLLDSNCHDTACEVANNVMKWHAVQQCLGLSKAQAVVQRCSAVVHYLALHAGEDTLKFRVLRNAHDDLRAILEVLQLNLRDSQHVGVLEGFVLWLWLSAKPDVTKVGLITAALRRIAALQDRVLTIFKNSAGILKCSAPGCVWRLLQRANAAEWLSHVCIPVALQLQLRCSWVFIAACALAAV